MPFRTDLSYSYDGTFEGLLSCVFESFDKKELPYEVLDRDREQVSFYPCKEIFSDPVKAKRVRTGIENKIGNFASELVELGYLSCMEEKELTIIEFLHLGFKYGPSVTSMLANDTVSRLTKAARFLSNEAHLLCGFIRFTDQNGYLSSVIEPKNRIIPVITEHFIRRFPRESFLIYDKNHREAVVYHKGQASFLEMVDFALPNACKEEQLYRSLWQNYYDAVAIEGRYNPKCRMTHMPKRYWSNMTELGEQFFDTPRPKQLSSPK